MPDFRYWLVSVLLIGSTCANAIDFETFSQKMRSYPGLQGHFEQQKSLQGFPKPLISTGQYTFCTKQGILWETLSPIASKMWLTPDAITVKNQFGQQSMTPQSHPIIRVVSTLMMSVFAADTTVLSEHFHCDTYSTSQGWTLTLRPKSDFAQNLCQDMLIQGRHFPEMISIIEKSGDRTVIRFSKPNILNQPPQGLDHGT